MIRSLASGQSAFSTFFQVVPRLARVVPKMRPTWHLAALAEVTPAWLAQQGLRGLIWDVDGTLTGDRRPKLEPESAAPFLALTSAPGIVHVILSNASEPRFRELSEMFPGIPLLRAYTKGDQVLYRRRLGTTDSWSDGRLEQELAAGARVIRKPSAPLVEYCVREMGLTKQDVVMIGDQYITDVAGANLAGVRSIKLPTLAAETFRTSVKISQRVEKLIYLMAHGRAK